MKEIIMKGKKELTPRLVIRESDVRNVEKVKEFFEPILRQIFGTAYIEVIND